MHETLRSVAWISLALSGVSTLVVACDVAWLRRQPMAVMNVVWPLTALYAGPLAVLAYFTFGRAAARNAAPRHAHAAGHAERPLWQAALLGATHCGAGCMVGDVVVDTLLVAAGATALLGSVLLTSYVFEFVAAFVLGIAFQYFAIVPMKGLPPGRGIVAALKADTFSLVAFQIGMYAWMALTHAVLGGRGQDPHSPVHWLFLQCGMLVGLATSVPANLWLVRRGIKERM
ncbi:MAG TPA: DUF4396 domain-containing protein [Polyangiaceae bacterium]|nr:DUF4396 domain-containing protein [Polyangiaceae bacterium]